jgi:hypothetical protein
MGLTNLYTKFMALAKTDLIIGTVISIETETSTLEDQNGYSFIAIGTNVPVSENAFVQNGVIQGTAPTLPETEVFV